MDSYYSYNCSHFESNASVTVSDIIPLKKKKKRSAKGGKCGGAVAAPVKLSTDPQSVAARERRNRISERFKTLQSLVPGGAKLDTVSMLDEAIHYVKFLKTQIWLHETLISSGSVSVSAGGYSEQFLQQPQLDELHCPRSMEWSQSSLDDGAAFGNGQSSLIFENDMAEVQFDYATTLF